MVNLLKSIWSYRQFILRSIKNDVINQYIRSKLGAAWALLNPITQVLIYALIFSNILAIKLPEIGNKYAYAIYLMAGLLAWNLFSDTISRCLTLFIDNANLLKKMQFPRITLPVIVMGTSFVNNMLLFFSIVVIFLLIGHQFTWHILLIFPLTVLLFLFALAIGLFLGVLNVFVRDIGQAVPVILQIGFWFTPIVYPLNIVPEPYQHLLALNPVFHFTQAYQAILVYGQLPEFSSIVLVAGLCLISLFFSLVLFRRAQAEMVDVL